MTENERKAFNVTFQAIDALLDALASGCGMHDFQNIRREWVDVTDPLRTAINDERKAETSREGSGQ